ncbi:hypothetical protein O3P69_016261 [Scylla paramamosain]|uniref:Uncharacterized protein n=1 Tax=Scylla paramamosain TaxID=85552 RepID=A0AAW0SEG5_SCYPA
MGHGFTHASLSTAYSSSSSNSSRQLNAAPPIKRMKIAATSERLAAVGRISKPNSNASCDVLDWQFLDSGGVCNRKTTNVVVRCDIHTYEHVFTCQVTHAALLIGSSLCCRRADNTYQPATPMLTGFSPMGSPPQQPSLP